MGMLTGLRKAGIADVLTVSNGACGLSGIGLLLTQGRDITLGSALVLLGFVLDGADGWAARRFGTKHDKGRYLDSISDAITFCAAPAVMTYVVFLGALEGEGMSTTVSGAFDMLVLVTALLMASLGWTRLYRFTTRGYRDEHFSGLASPAMAFLAILVCHILNPDRWDAAAVSLVAIIVLLLAALLMVAPVRYPKVRGRTAALFAVSVLAALAVIGIMRQLEVEGAGMAFRAVSLTGLGLVAGYVLLGPVYIAQGRRGGG
jgi:phosphatidylserine synthase